MQNFFGSALLLCSALLGAQALPITLVNEKLEQSWAAVSGITQHQWEDMMPKYDCRGFFQDFGLIVTNSPAELNNLSSEFNGIQAIPLAPVTDSSDDVWVVECFKDTTVCVENVLQTAKGSNIEPLFASAKAVAVRGAAEMINWPKDTNVISIAPSRMVPVAPVEHALLESDGFKFNNKIKDLISGVSKERIRETVETLSSFHTRQANSDGARAAQQWVFDQYKAMGLNVSTHAGEPGDSDNVIAELKGTVYPDQYVLVGAHYDDRMEDVTDPNSRAPGADDNGSGTAGLLEMARLITQSGLQFTYSIRFCSFSGEEGGLRGSRAYAAHLREINEKVVVMFNGDMLGYHLPGQPITLGMKDRYVSLWLLSVANTITNHYVPELPIAISPSCCSDHQSFTENGFNALGFFENAGSASDYPQYHTTQDVPENLDFDQEQLLVKAWASNLLTFAAPL